MRAANAVGPTHVRLTPEGSRRIRVYRNGDAHFKGITIVLNTRQVHNIDALLDMISEKIGLVMGCKRLFTLDGMPVKTMAQLQHNVAYVAASGPFTPVRYGRVGSASLHGGPSLLTRSSSNFSAASREDPLAQSGASKQSAPASLAPGVAHAPLRHSRSIEPRRVGRLPQMNGPTSRTDERSKKVDGKKARDGSKKRKTAKKKANDAPLDVHPPVSDGGATPEAKENDQNENGHGEEANGHHGEGEEEAAVGETAAVEEEEGEKEEQRQQQELAPRTRTEVEVVEHAEDGEEEEEEQHQQEEDNHHHHGDEEEQEEPIANGETTPESARSERAPTAQTKEGEEEAENEDKVKENGEAAHHPMTDEQKEDDK